MKDAGVHWLKPLAMRIASGAIRGAITSVSGDGAQLQGQNKAGGEAVSSKPGAMVELLETMQQERCGRARAEMLTEESLPSVVEEDCRPLDAQSETAVQERHSAGQPSGKARSGKPLRWSTGDSWSTGPEHKDSRPAKVTAGQPHIVQQGLQSDVCQSESTLPL